MYNIMLTCYTFRGIFALPLSRNVFFRNHQSSSNYFCYSKGKVGICHYILLNIDKLQGTIKKPTNPFVISKLKYIELLDSFFLFFLFFFVVVLQEESNTTLVSAKLVTFVESNQMNSAISKCET